MQAFYNIVPGFLKGNRLLCPNRPNPRACCFVVVSGSSVDSSFSSSFEGACVSSFESVSSDEGEGSSTGASKLVKEKKIQINSLQILYNVCLKNLLLRIQF